jgi:hypothetical protein
LVDSLQQFIYLRLSPWGSQAKTPSSPAAHLPHVQNRCQRVGPHCAPPLPCRCELRPPPPIEMVRSSPSSGRALKAVGGRGWAVDGASGKGSASGRQMVTLQASVGGPAAHLPHAQNRCQRVGPHCAPPLPCRRELRPPPPIEMVRSSPSSGRALKAVGG